MKLRTRRLLTRLRNHLDGIIVFTISAALTAALIAALVVLGQRADWFHILIKAP